MSTSICNICKIPLVLGENCKPSSFRHGTYLCRPCLSERNRNKRLLNLSETRVRERRKMRVWRESNPEKDLALQIRPYGIFIDELKRLTEDQNGVCKLCGKPPGVNPRQKRLCIGHDHETQRLRGLLCDPCNRALGILGDSPAMFAKILVYLTGSTEQAIEILESL